MSGARLAKAAALAEPVRGAWPVSSEKGRTAHRERRRKRPCVRSTLQAAGRVTTVCALAVLLLILIGQRAVYVAVTGRQILEWKEELRLLEAENKRLEARILALQAPQRVESDARTRLGMRPAEGIRAISVAGPPAGVGEGGEATEGKDGAASRTVAVSLAPDPARRAPNRMRAGADLPAYLRRLSGVLGAWAAGQTGSHSLR